MFRTFLSNGDDLNRIFLAYFKIKRSQGVCGMSWTF